VWQTLEGWSILHRRRKSQVRLLQFRVFRPWALRRKLTRYQTITADKAKPHTNGLYTTCLGQAIQRSKSSLTANLGRRGYGFWVIGHLQNLKEKAMKFTSILEIIATPS